MAFLGQHSVQNKIVVENKMLEKVNTFNYLGYQLSFEGEKYLQEKKSNFKI
jgi:hypothetical protein